MRNEESCPELVVFTDLDGCLLNATDYQFTDALPTLRRLEECQIPLVLCSSKTELEMTALAGEMGLPVAPLACENGGMILWPAGSSWNTGAQRTTCGASRTEILHVLDSLKASFRFRSFRDLTVDDVSSITDLPRNKALMAMDRHCTEPLLWEDSEDRLADFRARLEVRDLEFTRGGRFWHVSGHTNKGVAMREVIRRRQSIVNRPVISAAIGDSPIDQSMLDIADYPIAIPSPGGTVNVVVRGEQAMVASMPGAAGWAECVDRLLMWLDR